MLRMRRGIKGLQPHQGSSFVTFVACVHGTHWQSTACIYDGCLRRWTIRRLTMDDTIRCYDVYVCVLTMLLRCVLGRVVLRVNDLSAQPASLRNGRLLTNARTSSAQELLTSAKESLKSLLWQAVERYGKVWKGVV